MKSKITLSLVMILMAAVIISGATSAWFTDNADVPEAEFVAGTVIVEVDEEAPVITPMEGKLVGNVNPGDCAEVEWKITYEGTKNAELRVKIYKAWLGGLDTSNVALAPNSEWTMYEEATDENGEFIWFYRTVDGTYVDGGDNDPARDVSLKLKLKFDGPGTGNEYQGAEFNLAGDNSFIEAIQNSNGASEAVWTEASWVNRVVADVPEIECYTGTTPVDPVEPVFSKFDVTDTQGYIEHKTTGNWHNQTKYTNGKVTGTITALDTNNEVLTGYNETKSVTVSIKVGNTTKTDTFNVQFTNGVAQVDSGFFYVGSGHLYGISNVSIQVN